MDSGEKIWAGVTFWAGTQAGALFKRIYKYNRGMVTFERGYCFVTIPKTSILDIKPKDVLRKDLKTLRINSGLSHHGWVVLVFDSKEDADKVEQEFQKMLPLKTRRKFTDSGSRQ